MTKRTTGHWIAFLVSNAIILSATGWLSWVFGRKRFLIACIAIFTLASALCGAASSLVTTWVARQAQVHQAILVQHLTPYDSAMREWLATAQGALAGPSGGVTGAQQGWALLYNTLVTQATLWAYVDTFRMLALLCVGCLPAVLLLRKARSRGPVAVH